MSTLPGPNAALLVVDVQTGVVAEAWERDRVVANVALAVDRARAAGLAVIWVQHEDDELQPGTAAWQWVPELQPLPSEACVAKQFNSAFEGTPLLPLLDQAGVSRLYLAGAASNWCIRATAYGALERVSGHLGLQRTEDALYRGVFRMDVAVVHLLEGRWTEAWRELEDTRAEIAPACPAARQKAICTRFRHR